MTWVLIIIAMGRYDGGRAVDHVEFSTQESCQIAAKSINNANADYDDRINAICFKH